MDSLITINDIGDAIDKIDKSDSYAQRQIVIPYKKRIEDGTALYDIGTIGSPTGMGKTWAIQFELIPYDIKRILDSGVSARNIALLLTTPFVESAEQEFESLRSAVLDYPNDIRVYLTDDIDDFINFNGNYPKILVKTLSGTVTGGTDGNAKNGQRLIDHMKQKHGTLYKDEGGYSASSGPDTYGYNTGTGTDPKGTYKGTFYRFEEDVASLPNYIVTSFTATPVPEQTGSDIIPKDIGSKRYYMIPNEWPSVGDRQQGSSQIRKIITYSSVSDGFNTALIQTLQDFNQYENGLKLEQDVILKIIKDFPFKFKPLMLINTGADIDTENSLSVNQTLESLGNYLKTKDWYDLNSYIIVSCTAENGYQLFNLLGDKKIIKYAELRYKLKDANDPLQYIIHIEKFKLGINIAPFTYTIQLRNRKQIGAIEKIPSGPKQIWGRTVRTYWGIDFGDDNVPHRSTDVLRWVLDKYQDVENFETELFPAIMSYLKGCNTHTIFRPSTEVYNIAEDEWRKYYAIDVADSIFNARTYRELYSNVCGSGRDLAYKEHKKLFPYCQRHSSDGNDELCKAQQRPTFVDKGIYSTENFDEYWFKHLEVNHKDGDRNNNEKNNLETLCSTCHAIITQGEGHYNNTYENSRISS